MSLRTLVATLLLGVALALPASAERLRWASQGDALSLDPHANNETMTLRFLANVYDALVTRDQDLKIVPWLATEWRVIEPTRWRFTLRRGVKFHDGGTMTPADVVFSIKRAGSPTSGVSSHAAGIKAVEVIDDATLDIDCVRAAQLEGCPHFPDATVLDAHVGAIAWRAGAIDDGPAAKYVVMASCHFACPIRD